jgi:hypothetical protein
MDYKYMYITWVAYTAIIWFIIFLSRKDLRKNIINTSIIFGFVGLSIEYLHINDWWRPLTILGTKLSIEDFLGGFFVGGTASGIYEFITNKKLTNNRPTDNKLNLTAVLAITTIILFFGIYYILDLHSFYASLITLVYGTAFILWHRKDLIKNAMISGILMLAIGGIGYPVLLYLFPEFIQKFWFLNKQWFNTLLFGVPVQELIWWFFTGVFIGPLYKFRFRQQFII